MNYEKAIEAVVEQVTGTMEGHLLDAIKDQTSEYLESHPSITAEEAYDRIRDAVSARIGIVVVRLDHNDVHLFDAAMPDGVGKVRTAGQGDD